jgi:hypothetical protein
VLLNRLQDGPVGGLVDPEGLLAQQVFARPDHVAVDLLVPIVRRKVAPSYGST